MRRTGSLEVPAVQLPGYSISPAGIEINGHHFFKLDLPKIVHRLDLIVRAHFGNQDEKHACKHCGHIIGQSYSKFDAVMHLRSCKKLDKRKGTADFPSLTFLAQHHNFQRFAKKDQQIYAEGNPKRSGAQKVIEIGDTFLIDRAKLEAIYKRVLVAILISTANLPFRIVKNHIFRALTGTNYGYSKIRTDTLQLIAFSIEDELFENFVQSLKKGSIVSLCFDSYKNVQSRHILGVTVTCEGETFTYGTRFEGTTGLEYAKAVEGIILKLERQGVEVKCASSDDASNVKVARSIVANRFPYITFTKCYAHQISLITKEVLKLIDFEIVEQAHFLATRAKKSQLFGCRLERACFKYYGKYPKPKLKRIGETR